MLGVHIYGHVPGHVPVWLDVYIPFRFLIFIQSDAQFHVPERVFVNVHILVLGLVTRNVPDLVLILGGQFEKVKCLSDSL